MNLPQEGCNHGGTNRLFIYHSFISSPITLCPESFIFLRSLTHASANRYTVLGTNKPARFESQTPRRASKQKPSIISRLFRTRSWFRHIAASYKAPRYNTGSLFWSSILSEMSPGQPQPGGSSNPRCVTSSPQGLVLRPAARGTLGTGRGAASCSGRSVVAVSFVYCFYDSM